MLVLLQSNCQSIIFSVMHKTTIKLSLEISFIQCYKSRFDDNNNKEWMHAVSIELLMNATSQTSIEIRCIANGKAKQQSTSIKINQSISVAFFSPFVRCMSVCRARILPVSTYIYIFFIYLL